MVIVVGASIQVERRAGVPDVALIPLDALEAHIKGRSEELAFVKVWMRRAPCGACA